QEAKAAASLDHPNICTIYGVEEAEDGHLFIVMPCYEGETLAAKIARGPLALDEALDIGGQLAAGLAYAHAAGVVHRDVKPANVVITREGVAKILDFGIAKVADAHLTRTGTVLGTLAYMSPEQAAGERVDHRTDLWALGVVLHEMIAGTPPFTAPSREALYAAIQLQPAPGLSTLRSGVPERLETLVAGLLEKESEHRLADAREVAATLADVRRVTAAPAGAQPFSG
ncbi:MAG TPA: serine/threonine-protein kinase, partial [Gemmatimonadales bacterium]|nr:serine/threonine-protein kinase [Gemmatimonadales bacterium]